MKLALLVLTAFLVLIPGGAPAQSLNVIELGTLDSYTSYSDIWGYRAPDGKEYAILGTFGGTSFINTTDPAAPVEVAFIPGPNSSWRDIKTYQSYAYIVNETGDGLQIVNLANAQNPTLVKSDSTLFSNCHNIYVDEINGHLYCCAPDDQGMKILDLADPENPTLLLDFTDFYVHDVHVQSGVAYAAAVFSGFLGVIDVSSLPAYTVTDSAVTAGAFCHNTWATPDDGYCLTTDEVSGGHIQIFDVSTPADIFPVSEWTHPTDPASIVHNVTVNGDLAHISWYKTGLQILDIADPAFPQRVGYFDTFPGSGTGYDGAWGVYPFQPSGNIYLSDISTGLHVFSFDPDFGTATGTVTDTATLLPVTGVRVTVDAEFKEVFTLASGAYKLSLVPGNHDLVLEKFGYETDTVTVSVSRGANTLQDVGLVPLPSGSLGGFVGAYGSYTPLAGVVPVLSGTPLTAITDGGGHYSFPSVPQGAYTLSVDVFGYAPASVPVSIPVGQAVTENVTLFPAVFADDLETASGWTVGAPGDDAIRGIWERADPEGTGGGTVQPEDDHTPDPGTLAFVTQAAAGAGLGSFDVDGGTTTLLSPILDLTGIQNPVLSYHRWYSNDGGANPGTDDFIVDASDDGGGSWVNLETLSVSREFWEKMEFPLAGVISPTSQVQFRFRAADLGGGSIVEAAVDDVQIHGDTPTVGVPREVPPALVRILPAAPNPFRSATRIRYRLGARLPVRVDLFDIRGRQVAVLVDAVQDAGSHDLVWDGRGSDGRRAASGLYLLRLITPGRVDVQKLVLSR